MGAKKGSIDNQRGFSQITLATLVLLIVFSGVVYYLATQKRLPADQNIEQKNPSSITSQQSSNSTSDWRTYKYTDKSGFGYELRVPPDWSVIPWAGADNPEPKELAQVFYGKNCSTTPGLTKNDRILVLHFISSDPSSKIKNFVDQSVKNGFNYTKPTYNGITFHQLVGKTPPDAGGSTDTDYYIYTETSKGYYYISSRDDCSANIAQILDSVISTFNITN